MDVGISLANRILALLASSPGLTDRELTDRLFSPSTHPSQINQTCRWLELKLKLRRLARSDGKIGNYLETAALPSSDTPTVAKVAIPADGMTEDELKKRLETWLVEDGWKVKVCWGAERGIDILAERQGTAWIIEAKGAGSRQPMRVNYFLAVLGETLQRMTVREAKYSIALPDMTQFRRLWGRLPELAKRKTGISAIFVSESGAIEEVV